MEVYARVVDGEIKEFPVAKIHIENRQHPFSWYVLCTFDTKPTVTEFEYARQIPKVTSQGGVNISWVVEKYTLDQLLSRLPVAETEGPVRRGSQRPVEAPTEALITKIKELAVNRAQDMLDKFAGTKGYGTPPGGPGSLESAISYIGDKNAEWAADGTFCKNLRSDFWTAVYQYFNDVIATPQVKPWPNKWDDVVKHLPELKWPVAE